MTISDNTKKTEGLSDFFKILGKSSVNVCKKVAEDVLRNPGRALDVTANVTGAVASRKPKAASSSLPEVINFYYSGKGLYLKNLFDFMPSK